MLIVVALPTPNMILVVPYMEGTVPGLQPFKQGLRGTRNILYTTVCLTESAAAKHCVDPSPT